MSTHHGSHHQATTADEEFAQFEAEQMAATEPELDEVEVLPEDDETEELDEEKPTAKKAAKKAVAKKANARPAVPEGYIAPVAFAKELTKRLREEGKIAEDEEIPPQMIYAYIKNTAKGKDPLTSYEAGGRVNLLKLEEALAWWERKEERAAQRKAGVKKVAGKSEASVEETEAEIEAEEAE